jgi:hypothetical protein
LTLLAVIACAATASAEVFSPRVVSPHHPDAYDLRTLAHHPGWKELSDADCSAALVAWLTDAQRGLRFVERGPWEGADKVAEFAAVADPLKTLAVYGYGDRRALHGALAAIWEASGRGRARLAVADGQLVAELQYGGQWHAFDLVSRMPITVPTSKPRYDAFPTGHTLEFVLHRGERFTRWFAPQGERWHATDSQMKDAKLRAEWNAAPRGPKLDGQPLFAHGQFVYEPRLTEDAADFRDGVYDAANVDVTADGLTLVKAGDGFAIFEVRSPYIIVPEVGKLEDPKDDKDASVVELGAADVAVSYSRDYGATWLSLETKTFPARLDLTAQVAGGYGYLLRIDFKGQPGKSLVKSLKITTWVQVAPGLLPAVRDGRNEFALQTGDADGRPTFPVVIDASTADENNFLRPVIRPPREFVPGHPQQRVIGPFTARIAAAPHAKIAWLTVGGSFAFDPQSPRDQHGATIRYAFDRPSGFVPLALPELPADHAHPHYHLDATLRLDAPAPAVYLHCEGRPALNQFRATAHCVRDAPRPAMPLSITHRWTSAGTPRSHSVELTDRGDYAFDAGADVVNESIEFAVGDRRD